MIADHATRSRGVLTSISGPLVRAEGLMGASVGDQVEVGDEHLVGEVISLNEGMAVIQVYEDTTGLVPGAVVTGLGIPLSVELGPGLMGGVFDGLQRPLKALAEASGTFLTSGLKPPALDRETTWRFTPTVTVGNEVRPLSIIGEVRETESIVHRILVPRGVTGIVSRIAEAGEYRLEDELAVITSRPGNEIPVRMLRTSPVRIPRPLRRRMLPREMLTTGQRVIDFFFPIPKGGVAAIPGGFGSGKTTAQHALAKWADADVVVYVGCGERGNEMTQVMEEFPHLTDPRTGRPLMERTILVANTSNMPVTARESSVYTAITMAEYYRDMGYHVAMMADSTSRWAEALREMSGRLEEMPAEEGYPAYLASRLAEFYERAGYGEVFPGRVGSITAVGAVSPQGGDFSEPVTQHTRRFTRTFWALDKALAGERHFPSINWFESYSEYCPDLVEWWQDNHPEIPWTKLRTEALRLLQEEEQLQKVARLVGPDALPDAQRLVLAVASVIKTGFLQQNAFDIIDCYCPVEKQLRMIQVILQFNELAVPLIKMGIPVTQLLGLEVVTRLKRMKSEIRNSDSEAFRGIVSQMTEEIDELRQRYGG